MAEPRVVAYDVGTTNVKAVLTDLDGEVLGVHTRGLPLRRLSGGRVEQELDDIDVAMAAATRGLLAETSTLPARIAAVAVTGQMFNVVPVFADRTRRHPMLSWLDQRAVDDAVDLERRLSAEEQFAMFDAVLTAKDIVPRINWMARRQPRLDAEVAVYLDCKEAVVHRLTGHAVTDPVGASAYRLFDAESGCWGRDRCRAARVDLGQLPEVRSAFAAAGDLLPSAARTLGLQPGTPVAVGCGDVATSQLGSGAVLPGDVQLSLGTSGYFGFMLDQHLQDPGRRLGPLAHALPDRWILWLEIATAGGALTWLEHLVSTDGAGERFSARLSSVQVREAARGMDGLIFAPWLSGERVPLFDDSARGAFIGLGLHHDARHLTRAVMEGVAYQMRWAFEYGLAFGVAPRTIRVVGGGGMGTGWLQVIADVLGRRLEVVDEASHTAARASAMIAIGMLAGRHDLPDQPVDVDRIVVPDPRESDRHAHNFDRFRNLHQALAQLELQPSSWSDSSERSGDSR